MENFYCLECRSIGGIGLRGRCLSCGSDAVLETPRWFNGPLMVEAAEYACLIEYMWTAWAQREVESAARSTIHES